MSRRKLSRDIFCRAILISCCVFDVFFLAIRVPFVFWIVISSNWFNLWKLKVSFVPDLIVKARWFSLKFPWLCAIKTHQRPHIVFLNLWWAQLCYNNPAKTLSLKDFKLSYHWLWVLKHFHIILDSFNGALKKLVWLFRVILRCEYLALRIFQYLEHLAPRA